MSSRLPRPGLIKRAAWGIRNAWAVTTGGGSALPPWDDYWYSRPGWDSAAGMAVTPETSMRLAAVFACVRVRSESLASCPCVIFKRLPDGGKVRAPEHPLYKLFHNSPNIWQTSLEFFEMMQAHLDLRGNAFSHIVPGPSGPIDQLIPLHPDLVQVYRLPNGKLKYQVRSRFSGEVRWYLQEEIFHLRGLSSDGLVGLSPIAIQRETMGTGLGLQDYGARFFANDATASKWIKHPGRFKDDAARNTFRENWQKSQTGENRFKTPVLEDGLELKSMSLSNKDSQFLEAKNATATDICGMFRVPPHKIGMLDRATHSNIEHQGIEFVTDCMRPIAVRWERRINADLIDPISDALGDDEYFIEFIVDGLLRGALKDRYDAYQVGRNGGWLCPNDICSFEGLNRIPAEKGGDDYLRPVNYVIAGAPQPAIPAFPGPPQPEEPPANPDNPKDDAIPPENPAPDAPDDEGADAAATGKLLKAFATEAAGRVVRKEVAALRKMLARDPASFDERAEAFYVGHAALAAQTMCISPAAATRYARSNFKLICEVAEPAEKSCALDWIEDTAPEALAALALASKRPKPALQEKTA